MLKVPSYFVSRLSARFRMGLLSNPVNFFLLLKSNYIFDYHKQFKSSHLYGVLIVFYVKIFDDSKRIFGFIMNNTISTSITNILH